MMASKQVHPLHLFGRIPKLHATVDIDCLEEVQNMAELPRKLLDMYLKILAGHLRAILAQMGPSPTSSLVRQQQRKV